LVYYCNSRQIKESFQTLFSLMVSDKIKSTLPEACLDHVLTAQGDTWLECDALANIVDIYFANHTNEGRPRSVRSDFRNRPNNSQDAASKVGPTNNTAGGERGASSISAQVNRPLEIKNMKNGTPFQTGNRDGLCFTCHSPGQ